MVEAGRPEPARFRPARNCGIGFIVRRTSPTPTGNQFEQQCRANGMRLTGARRLIAEVLAQAHDHPDVPELHRRMATCDKRVSLTTVYRTVKRFEEAGIIERHAFRDGRARYEAASNRHHDHLIDLETGRVIEFRSEEIERLQAAIARQLGYKLVGHRLELYARAFPSVRECSNENGGGLG